MKCFVKWCDWEMKNEFLACGYFCVMLTCYGIVEWICGRKDVNIIILLEMFLLNYVITLLQRLILNEDRDYEKRSYYKRASILLVVSFCMTVLACHGLAWFKGRSIYAELFLYSCMIMAYLFVWWIQCMIKKYDTVVLNEQLKAFQEEKRGRE